MKYLLLTLWLALLSPVALAQSPEAEALVEEGIVLHDEGDYDGAMQKYTAALEMEDGKFFTAEAEMSHTLFFQEKFDDCMDLCESIIKKYPKEEHMGMVFTTLGNALDLNGRPKEAIDAYERGIARHPETHLLHFNLGVTYAREGKADQAKARLLEGVELEPNHPGGHYVLGVVMLTEDQRTPALLALLRVLLVEYGTQRSTTAAGLVLELINGNAEKTGRNEININADAARSGDEYDNFFASDLILDMSGAMAQGKDWKKKTKKMDDAEKLHLRLQTVVGSVSEMYDQGDLKGPFTKEYVPFYQSMESEEHLLTLCYMLYAELDEKFAREWVEEHLEAIESLLNWVFGVEED